MTVYNWNKTAIVAANMATKVAGTMLEAAPVKRGKLVGVENELGKVVFALGTIGYVTKVVTVLYTPG